jgi:prepilin-type N-terminal cleavage/methylation domain-containing protein
MKKAFTLIELLVVIAIIAILAAILFPVFAQAKAAAKKAGAISNQKQLGLGIILYTGDWDDKYPQTDACEQGSSLNPKFKAASYNGSGSTGCGVPSATVANGYNRVNSYSWQKWIMPYVKSVDLFSHPGRQKDPTMWDMGGQIMNGFAINTAITGSANVSTSTNQLLRVRNSWLGGTQSAIPDVAGAMILMEFANSKINFVPMAMTLEDYNKTGSFPISQTVYPPAWREFWGRLLMKWTNCSGANMSEISNQPDPKSVFAGGVALGMADGSAKFYSASKFLASTPTAAEYSPLDSFYACGQASEIMRPVTPNLNIDYPLWGLVAQ